MAFILGIYTRLIDAIKSFDTAWLAALVTCLQVKAAAGVKVKGKHGYVKL